jgi:hypothetical protein
MAHSADNVSLEIGGTSREGRYDALRHFMIALATDQLRSRGDSTPPVFFSAIEFGAMAKRLLAIFSGMISCRYRTRSCTSFRDNFCYKLVVVHGIADSSLPVQRG